LQLLISTLHKQLQVTDNELHHYKSNSRSIEQTFCLCGLPYFWIMNENSNFTFRLNCFCIRKKNNVIITLIMKTTQILCKYEVKNKSQLWNNKVLLIWVTTTSASRSCKTVDLVKTYFIVRNLANRSETSFLQRLFPLQNV